MTDIDLGVLDRGSAALLVIDMQNAFAHPDGTLGSSGVDLGEVPAVIDAVGSLVRAAKMAGLPVIWTRQVHLSPDWGRQAKRLVPHTSKRPRVAALDGSWDAALVDEFAGYESSVDVVVKHRFGGFHDTRLDTLLRMRGVRSLVVAGATANACVDSTIREAYMRDYDVVVPLDAVAAVNPEWKRLAAETWNHYFAAVTTTATVLSWLQPTPGGHP